MLKSASADGASVRFAGAGTKDWGRPSSPDLVVSSLELDSIVEHNAGDLTAVLEPGVRLADAQARFAEKDQMLVLDPPLGQDDAATIGGIVAAGDTGPLRGRYGGGRDLVVGMTVALSDGTIARTGSHVIKNVAGYDLAKLFAGSLGTLGMILELTVRLHPRPERTATALGRTGDPERLGRAAMATSHAPLEHEGIDVRYADGEGMVLARFGGAAPVPQAESAERVMAEAGLDTELIDDADDELWQAQRDGQSAASGTVVKVSGLQTELPRIAACAARLEAPLVGRAGLGLYWLRIEGRSPKDAAATVDWLRGELSPAPCVVLDAPAEVRDLVDPWGAAEGTALDLMRRVKERFDPAGSCNPGVFVGGI